MAERRPIRRALISVYDKTGVVDFARALHGEFGIEIISTGGTAKLLREAGIPVTLVEELTGFPEMLDGRVKTLHPAIHAAILADRDNLEHMRQLETAGIKPIDMVVVNLYPFEKTVADPNCTFEQAIEMIDIGGVALLRAAAKNHRHVLVLSARADQQRVLGWLRDAKRPDDADARDLAWGALWACAGYDAAISSWMSRDPDGHLQVRALRLWNWGALRYGENPHERAELYKPSEHSSGLDLSIANRVENEPAQPELSYNNYLDADAALGLCAELTRARIQLWYRRPAGDSRVAGVPPATHLGGSTESPGHAGAHRAAQSAWQAVSDERISRRNLPHIQVPGRTYFVTFRTRKDVQLTEDAREVVLSACRFWHGLKMNLHIAAVMPDHVHLLLTPYLYESGGSVPLSDLLHSIKSFSSHEINNLSGGRGPTWLDEAFDRIMRDEAEFIETWEYIERNPERAGLGDKYAWVWKSEARFEESGWIDLSRLPPSERRRAMEHRRDAGATEKGLDQEHRRDAGATGQGPEQVHRRDVGTTGEGPEQEHRRDAGATVEGPSPADAKAHYSAVFIKHSNPCGAGVALDPIDAYRLAYLGDPNAAMGGVLAVSFDVTADFASIVMATYDRFGKPLKDAGAANAPGGFFIEVWLAPSFSDDAVKIIRTRKKWGENVRLLAVGDMSRPPDPKELLYRSIAGGMLVQTPDLIGLNEEQWRVVTKRAPTESELSDLRLAWLIAKHTKSNAISLVKDGMLIGNGAGQMSRVMSCRVATWLARENGHLGGSASVPPASRQQGTANTQESGTEDQRTRQRRDGPVAASDAFFPFRDGPDILIDAGVTAIIQPGGSKRDEETIAACDERGVAMIFTGTRHFRH